MSRYIASLGFLLVGCKGPVGSDGGGQGSIDIGDWAAAFAAIFAGVGLLLNSFQLARSIREKGIEKVSNAVQLLHADEVMWETYTSIEYDWFKYEPKNFHGSIDEIKIDKLLAHLDSLAKLKLENLIKLKDLDLVAYEYIKVYKNAELSKYLSALESKDYYDEKSGTSYEFSRTTFRNFREVGEQLTSSRGRNWFMSKGTDDSSNRQFLVSLTAIAVALGVALYSNYSTQEVVKEFKVLTMPILRLDISHDEPNRGVQLRNVGLGPAQIDTFAMIVAGDTLINKSTQEIFEVFKDEFAINEVNLGIISILSISLRDPMANL